MFDSFALTSAREQCIAIARDHIAHLKGERKAQALAHIAAILSCWKLEQADPDGTIEIDPLKLELLGAFPRGMSISDLAVEPGRRPIAEVQPWECAGSGVRCDADLFARLAYGGDYSPAGSAEQELGPGVAVALLLERDGMTMPVDSLADAVRHLWIIVSATAQVYRAAVNGIGKKAAAAAAQRLDASAKGAVKNRLSAEYAHADWRSQASSIWRADPQAKADYIAQQIVDAARDPKPRVRTVRDAIKGVKSATMTTLARSAKRTTPTA
jgi:hypothetical protein